MSKFEETNTTINMIIETINTSNMYFLSKITILCDIAKSLAVIADSISEKNDDKKM